MRVRSASGQISVAELRDVAYEYPVAALDALNAEELKSRLVVKLGVAKHGRWVEREGAPDYVEDDAAAYMKGQDLRVGIDLGLGEGAFTAWTCDLTAQYIAINADYRS